LDDQRLTPQTRTERLLQAITFDTLIKAAPVASIAGVPLALIAAKDYTVGYASHFGIPEEFVKADPTTAFVPFSIIAGVLLIGLMALHEVERLGPAEALRSFGRLARLFFFGTAIGVYGSWARSGEEDVADLIATVLVLYLLLWWAPRLFSLILRQHRRVDRWMVRFIPSRGRRRGHAAAWLGSLLPTKAAGKLLIATLVFTGVTTLPGLLGTWKAMGQSTFSTIDRGKHHTEVILGVYGDKAFLGWVEDDAVVVEVQMVAVSDLRGKPIRTEEIGPLTYDPFYLDE
jgi:hypothetical protein